MDNEIRSAIVDLLHEIGVPQHLKGHVYIVETVMLALDDKRLLDNMQQMMYPRIAEKFSTTSDNVRQAIRRAISITFDRGDIEHLSAYFSYSLYIGGGLPTNREFIALIVYRICTGHFPAQLQH